MRYKAAVIGCGRIGFEFDKDPKRKYIATHTGAYSCVKETELVAVCDVNRKRLKECVNRLSIPEGYSDFNVMLKKENIDILSICTPPHIRYSILKEVVKFPLRAIFCEKPIADSVKDAKKMVRLCKERKVILQVDHQRRFDPLHINLREFIEEKIYGGVQQINFYYTAGIENTGSHMFDLLRFLFGEVDWIESFFSKNNSHKNNDPNLDGIMRFKSGVFATFQACDVKKYLVFELNCLLDKGRFVLRNSGFSADFYRVKESSYFSGYKGLVKVKSHVNMGYKRNPMVKAVEHLVRCIKEDKRPISSGEDGLAALQLIDASICSAKKEGRRIILEK